MPIFIPDDLTKQSEKSFKKAHAVHSNDYGTVKTKKVVIGVVCLAIAIFCILSLVHVIGYGEVTYASLYWLGGGSAISLFQAIYCYITRKEGR